MIQLTFDSIFVFFANEITKERGLYFNEINDVLNKYVCALSELFNKKIKEREREKKKILSETV